MELLIRPALGLLQGLIIYWLIKKTNFSFADFWFASVIFSFPLLALQIKLPTEKMLFKALVSLILMGLIFGFASYYLIHQLENTPNFVTPVLISQLALSAFIFLCFHCVSLEEKRFNFPYLSLFNEAWTIILKIVLGLFLVFLTWGLFFIAGHLFSLLNIYQIRTFVQSDTFAYICIPLFFGIAMTILYEHEKILTKLRNILLAFCYFLYPLFVIIVLSFLIVIPFANKDFSSFWSSIMPLAFLNILLFNGIFQAGFKKKPYRPWFNYLIQALFIILSLYCLYIFYYPLKEMHLYGIKPLLLLLVVQLIFLTLYHLGYSFAFFHKNDIYVSYIKKINVFLALLTGIIYLLLALPGFNVGKLAASNQLSRLLDNKPLFSPDNRGQGAYLAGLDLSNIDLSGKDLRQANFASSTLLSANLSNTNLQNATFTKANLSNANLSEANLENADFNESNLENAKLIKANLHWGRFQKTNLTQADLSQANLDGAWFYECIFKSTKFNQAFLENSTGLNQDNLNNACAQKAKLPKNLTIKPCQD